MQFFYPTGPPLNVGSRRSGVRSGLRDAGEMTTEFEVRVSFQIAIGPKWSIPGGWNVRPRAIARFEDDELTVSRQRFAFLGLGPGTGGHLTIPYCEIRSVERPGPLPAKLRGRYDEELRIHRAEWQSWVILFTREAAELVDCFRSQKVRVDVRAE